MDTHMAPHPRLELEAFAVTLPEAHSEATEPREALTARVPGESNTVRLADGELEDAASAHTAEAASPPGPEVPLQPRGRSRLLWAGAAATILAALTCAVAFDPAHWRETVDLQLPAAWKARPVVAPAAALAQVRATPRAPVVVEKRAPESADRQLAEVMSLGTGAKRDSVAQPASKPNQATEIKPAKADASAAPAPPPSGYVASEPGADATPGASVARSGAPGALNQTPGLPAPAAPIGPAPRDGAAAITPAKAPTEISEAARDPAPQPVSAASPVVAAKRDVATVAAELRAGPMSDPQQIEVLGLVTEMAGLVRDLRTEVAELRRDVGRKSSDTDKRLAEFERRVSLAEARRGLAEAKSAGSPAAPAGQAEPAASAPPQTAAAPPTHAAVASAPAAPKRYRVQAASPGLAMLAEIDRSGGDGATLQLAVGDIAPGYGKVKSIAQQGTKWVVVTEGGTIQ